MERVGWGEKSRKRANLLLSRTRANLLLSRKRANLPPSRKRANLLLSRTRASLLLSRKRANLLMSRNRGGCPAVMVLRRWQGQKCGDIQGFQCGGCDVPNQLYEFPHLSK